MTTVPVWTTATVTASNNLKAELARGQLTVVAGSGVTAAATDSASTATWKGLILDGIDRVEASGDRDGAWATRAREDVNSRYSGDLIVAAEKVTSGLGGIESPGYKTWLSESVGQLRIVKPELPEAVARLARTGALTITTNYDDILTEATGWRETTWRDEHRVSRIMRNDDHGVIHIHGHWADSASVVFGSTSYAQVMLDPAAVEFLRSGIYSRTLLYVGFGAGLDDPNFASLRNWRRRSMAGSAYPQYRLVTEDEAARLSVDPTDGMLPVVYGTSHAQLPDFLNNLATVSSVAGLRGLSIVNPAPHVGEEKLDRSVVVITLPPRRASEEQLTEFIKLSGRLADIRRIVEDTDESAAAADVGGTIRLAQYQRFVHRFIHELDDIEAVVGARNQVESPTIERALDWSRALLGILEATVDADGNDHPAPP